MNLTGDCFICAGKIECDTPDKCGLAPPDPQQRTPYTPDLFNTPIAEMDFANA